MKIAISSFAACFCAAVAQSAPIELTYWDFLGGGDGIRMKQIVSDFNKSQSEIQVTESTLTWGTPFYTKVHTAVVVGQTPDVMTYHISHFPAGIAAGDLRPFKPEELAAAGLKESDFQPTLIQRSLEISKKYGHTDQLFAIPLDMHGIVLYYNKTVLQKAGVLGPDGKPTGLDGINAFTEMLTQIKNKTHLIPMAESTSSDDPASTWRVWYSLFRQQEGEFVKNGALSLEDLNGKGTKALQVIADWAKQGLIPKNTTYSAMIALFTSGRAAMMVNGVWEVPTVVDLQNQKKLPFDYGIVPFPKLFQEQLTWADSHELAIPNNQKSPLPPERVAAVMKFIAFVVNQLTWAGGGHIPAYLPVQESEAYKQMSPNNEYAAGGAKDLAFEPPLPIFGVGGPTFEPISNFLIPAINGLSSVDDGMKKFSAELGKFAKEGHQ